MPYIAIATEKPSGQVSTTPIAVLPENPSRLGMIIQAEGAAQLWYYWGEIPGSNAAWLKFDPTVLMMPALVDTLYIRAASGTIDYSIIALRGNP